MQTTLKKIEEDYRRKIQKVLDSGESLSATQIVELSLILFKEFKIKNISNSNNTYSDMLLYQYGTYNWGDEFGDHFSFDITRQFINPTDDEPYQLNLTLIFESEPFKELDDYNCWSSDFDNIESFAAHIKDTDGFRIADRFIPKTYTLIFSQC